MNQTTSSGHVDAEEQFHQLFCDFVAVLRILAMDAASQCRAWGDFNIAQELKHETLAGRGVIGKGKLDQAEESAVAALAVVINAVPDSALVFAEGHAANVKNMTHPAWKLVRAQAASLLTSLASRILESKAYYEKH